MTLVGVAVGAALAIVAVFIPWLPDAASEQADIIDSVYWVVTIICVVVFAVVAGVSGYAVYKFRAPPGDMDDGSPIHGNTSLEITWTLIPAILVTGIAVYSGVALAQSEELPPDHRTIEVTGEQFAWTFTYPDVEVEGGKPLTTGELVVPIDQTIAFEITSKDVIHSFWVPEWRMKQDAVNGIVTHTTVTPTEIGTFPVICTELCGLGHAIMRSNARVLSQADYNAWVEEQKRLAREGGVDPREGALHAAVRQLPYPRRRRDAGSGRARSRQGSVWSRRRLHPAVDRGSECRDRSTATRMV